jgi:hypothetical protein
MVKVTVCMPLVMVAAMLLCGSRAIVVKAAIHSCVIANTCALSVQHATKSSCAVSDSTSGAAAFKRVCGVSTQCTKRTAIAHCTANVVQWVHKNHTPGRLQQL